MTKQEKYKEKQRQRAKEMKTLPVGQMNTTYENMSLRTRMNKLHRALWHNKIDFGLVKQPQPSKRVKAGFKSPTTSNGDA